MRNALLGVQSRLVRTVIHPVSPPAQAEPLRDPLSARRGAALPPPRPTGGVLPTPCRRGCEKISRPAVDSVPPPTQTVKAAQIPQPGTELAGPGFQRS